MSDTNFRVWSNPFAAYDHLGRPCGAILCDPVNHVPYGDPKGNHEDPEKRVWEARRFVGAELDKEKTTVLLSIPSRLIHDQDTQWKFSEEAVEVPDTIYYREHLAHGALFAADEFTAKAVGLKFVPREEALAAAKVKLAAQWDAHYPGEQRPEWAPELKLTEEENSKVVPISRKKKEVA